MLPRRVSPAPCGGAGGSDHRRRSKFAPMAAWSRSPPYRSGPALPCPNFAKPMALHESLGIRRLGGRSTWPAETMPVEDAYPQADPGDRSVGNGGGDKIAIDHGVPFGLVASSALVERNPGAAPGRPADPAPEAAPSGSGGRL